jgi:hypothetical protein
MELDDDKEELGFAIDMLRFMELSISPFVSPVRRAFPDAQERRGMSELMGCIRERLDEILACLDEQLPPGH